MVSVSGPPAASGGLLTPIAQRARGLLGHPLGGLAVAWAVLIVIFALTAPNFLTVANFSNVARASAIAGTAAVAITVPLITGSLDVSFGAIMSVGALMAATQIGGGVAVPVALAISLLTGAVLGLVNGLLVTRMKLDSLIVTLGTLSIFGGLAFLWTAGAPTPAPGDAFAYYGRGFLLGIPMPVLVFGGIAILLGLHLRYSVIGQWSYLVGDNPRAAALAGVRVVPTKVVALVISGAVAALAGTMIAANDGVAIAGSGERTLLTAIAAVVLGGTSLAGGVGGVAGTVMGVLFLGTIDNGLNLLGVPGTMQDTTRGLVLVAALILDHLRYRGR